MERGWKYEYEVNCNAIRLLRACVPELLCGFSTSLRGSSEVLIAGFSTGHWP